VAELLGPPPSGQAEAPHSPLMWVEEGTEWAEGLYFILRTAARAERVLAFPETRAAAARDRRSAQPTGFALSAAHYRRLQADLAARLPANGLTARALRKALATDRPGLLDRWLRHRLRRPLGLAGLTEVTVVAADRPATTERDLFVALGITSGHVAPEAAVAPRLAFA
jgi:hypothetical protein